MCPEYFSQLACSKKSIFTPGIIFYQKHEKKRILTWKILKYNYFYRFPKVEFPFPIKKNLKPHIGVKIV